MKRLLCCVLLVAGCGADAAVEVGHKGGYVTPDGRGVNPRNGQDTVDGGALPASASDVPTTDDGTNHLGRNPGGN